MDTSTPPVKRRRGRPPAGSTAPEQTRESIIRTGVIILTEQGFAATGIDKVLKQAQVPKGSFYHYFASKEAFILEVVDAYGVYFARKLDRHFSNEGLSPLARLEAFIEDAIGGVKRHRFERGCLIGNLGQEVSVISPALRERVENVLQDWEARLARCLEQAVTEGELSPACDCKAEASYFWTGWEGAVMRARLQQDAAAMALFGKRFIQSLPD